MQPFTTHTGIVVPLIKDDINTDQIAPVQSMRSLKPDYKALLFMRARWREYMDAYEDMIRHTATPDAPWFVVPADHKWFARLIVSAAIVDAMKAMRGS